MPVPLEEAREAMLKSWFEVVNEGRRTPLSRQDAMKLFWAAHGGILADNERDHNEELARLLEEDGDAASH